MQRQSWSSAFYYFSKTIEVYRQAGTIFVICFSLLFQAYQSLLLCGDYQCLPPFTFSNTIRVFCLQDHQSLLFTRPLMSYFLYFQGLNFVFSSFKDAFVSGIRRRKVKKILWQICPLLAIHVDNHLSDKFVFLCHVGDFINGDGRKLMAGYICRTFYTFRD